MRNSVPQKSVYFLGAGASKASDFKLPTMSEFFTEEDFKQDKYPALHKFIGRVFPKVSFKELNLEEVITRLELSIDRFGAFGEHPEPYLYEARREFDRYVQKRLTYQPNDNRMWCQKHRILFERLNNNDSIITLNYDLIVDSTLYEISPKGPSGELKPEGLLYRMYSLLGQTRVIGGELPSLYFEHAGLGHYLKLHGSIDWLYCPYSSCGIHQLFFRNHIDGKSGHYSPGDLCIRCGSPLVSVIIPPTMNKTFIEYPKLGLLWTLAWKEIRAADKLVLIGMSLPESDYYLKWLINSAISAREKPPLIGVVNRDETVREKIEKLVGKSPEYLGDFCKYIEDIKTA